MASFSVINNIASANAQANLATTNIGLQKALNRLSSGLRINSSGDDAAGLAVANAYRSNIAVLNQGIRNAGDGLSTLQIKDGALNNISTEIMEGIPRNSPVYDSYIENTPMQDVGEPEDVAALARFLIGPEARWITGQIINVDGGHSLRRGPDFSAFIEPALGRDVMLAKTAPK